LAKGTGVREQRKKTLLADTTIIPIVAVEENSLSFLKNSIIIFCWLLVELMSLPLLAKIKDQ